MRYINLCKQIKLFSVKRDLMKQIKLFGLLALVMVTSIIVVACGGKTTALDVDFEVGYSNMSVSSSESHDAKLIVKTLQEWNALSGARIYLNELDEKYNESFFSENALIMYAFTKGGNMEITKVSIKGKVLAIEAIYEPWDMAMVSNGIIILEVKKSDISGANSVVLSA